MTITCIIGTNTYTLILKRWNIMRQFSDIYKKCRQSLNKVAFLIAWITFVLEILVSILMIQFLPEMIKLPIPTYIIFYIILPSIGYFLLVFIGRIIIKNKKLSDTTKNFYSILILTLQIFIIACVHNVFVFTLLLFIIPLILTVIYSDRKITNIITIISIVLIIISSIVSLTDSQENDLLHAIEVYIAIILIIGCNLIANLVTSVEKDKNDLIIEGAFKQLQLEELIKCDPLTGLYNIASFFTALDAHIKSNERPLTLAVIDIDNFKNVNDTWGHEKANNVLIYIASQLQACCSTKGYVYRYGGEEFTIIFPNTSPKEAKSMIENARKNIYKHKFDVPPNLNITFSCGIAAYPSPDCNAHDFFQLADKLMYQAKFSGKNKIITDNEFIE